jgi:hypothetical protein
LRTTSVRSLANLVALRLIGELFGRGEATKDLSEDLGDEVDLGEVAFALSNAGRVLGLGHGVLFMRMRGVLFSVRAFGKRRGTRPFRSSRRLDDFAAMFSQHKQTNVSVQQRR